MEIEFIKDYKRYNSNKLRFSYINRFIRGDEILDIGSSEGEMNRLIKETNPNKRVYSLDKHEKADFKIDLDKPRKINNTFDTIIAGEVIEHLISPINFIKYCKKLLNKNGRIILTTPNATGLQYIKDPGWCVYYKNYRGHTQTFTTEMLKRIFEDEGFKVIYIDYINAFWRRNPLKIIPFFIKRLRTDIIIVAEI